MFAKNKKESQPGHVEDIAATEMLREDHRAVKGLFEEFVSTEESEAKKRLVDKALIELTIHAKLEEELFYPAVRKELEDDALMDEAAEEHHVAKLLVAELASMTPSDKHYDAKFTVLAENVRRHIQEEEDELLPRIESSNSDLESLGQEMAERKLILLKEVSLESIRDEAPSEVEGIVSVPSRKASKRSGGGRSSSRRVGGRSRSRAKA
jgi:hemerythrin superfamily protein